MEKSILFLVLSKTRKTPRLCGFSFWEVFQLGLATRIPTMCTLSLLQLNASVVYAFLTCTLFSAATAYAYVFKEICISESFREMKTNSLFLMGSCFALFSQVKEAEETLVWQRFCLALPHSFYHRSKFFKVQWGGGKGGKIFLALIPNPAIMSWS